MVPSQRMKRPPGQGRNKVELKKIKDAGELHVSFLKRQEELSKKVSECGGLCGAEVAVFGLSPHGKVFSCGHPSAYAVVDRYLTEPTRNYPHVPVPVHEPNHQFFGASRQMEVEKEQGAMIEQLEMADKGWWSEPIDGLARLGLEELEKRKEAMQEMLKRVHTRANELTMMGASSSQSPSFPINRPPVNHVRPVNRFNNQTTSSMVPLGFGFGRGKF